MLEEGELAYTPATVAAVLAFLRQTNFLFFLAGEPPFPESFILPNARKVQGDR